MNGSVGATASTDEVLVTTGWHTPVRSTWRLYHRPGVGATQKTS